MDPTPFVPDGFDPPRSLVTDRFRLEPLGPEHNDADLAAWSSSIETHPRDSRVSRRPLAAGRGDVE